MQYVLSLCVGKHTIDDEDGVVEQLRKITTEDNSSAKQKGNA